MAFPFTSILIIADDIILLKKLYFALYRNVTIWPLVQFSLIPNVPFFGPDIGGSSQKSGVTG